MQPRNEDQEISTVERVEEFDSIQLNQEQVFQQPNTPSEAFKRKRGHSCGVSFSKRKHAAKKKDETIIDQQESTENSIAYNDGILD